MILNPDKYCFKLQAEVGFQTLQKGQTNTKRRRNEYKT